MSSNKTRGLHIRVEPYTGGYLATDDEVNRHGEGRTIKEALNDYGDNLIGYFESLKEHYPKLSDKLRRDLEFLNQTINCPKTALSPK